MYAASYDFSTGLDATKWVLQPSSGYVGIVNGACGLLQNRLGIFGGVWCCGDLA